MDIRVKVKPIIVEASDKKKLINKLRVEYGYYRRSPIIGVNYQKRRRKVDKVYSKSTGLLTAIHTTRAHWVAYVYVFSSYVLEAAGLKVEQGNRNFKLVPIK